MLRLSIALFLVQAGFQGFTASIPIALARAGRSDAEIGAIVGIAALVQIAAALAGGALIDRFGAMRLFLVGGLCYLGAAALLFATGVGPSATSTLIAARILQGTGIGLCIPSVLTVVPSLVSNERRSLAIASAGMAQNLTLVVLPPISLAVLDMSGMQGVTTLVAVLVIVALVLALARPLTPRQSVAVHLDAASRRFGFAYRRSWLGPIAVALLYGLHWGVLTAYLPQRAASVGANIGLFFAADGVFVLLGRIPAGWLADRIPPVVPVVTGVALTAGALAVLMPLPSDQTLMLAGTMTGIGAVLVIQPLLLALTGRSNDADRGSAFALYSAFYATALAAGAVGTAPFIDSVGFDSVLVVALLALALSSVVAVADAGLRRGGSPLAEGAGLVGP